MPSLLILIVVAIGLKILLSLLWSAMRFGVAPSPTTHNERKTVGDIIAGLPPDYVVIDLGSGWGGMLRYLASRFPDRNFFGIEGGALPYLTCRAGQIVERLLRPSACRPNVVFVRGNFLESGLQGQRVYIAYLSGPAMRRLRHRFEEDQPDNARLISVAFAMPGWTATEKRISEGALSTPVYRYDL